MTFDWKQGALRLSEAVHQMALQDRIERVARLWVDADQSNQATPDQDTRLQIEEFMQWQSLGFRQPHLVSISHVDSGVDVEQIRSRLEAAAVRYPSLQCAFEPTHVDESVRRQILSTVAADGVAHTGLHAKVRTKSRVPVTVQNHDIAFELASLSHNQFEIIESESSRPFDTAAGPLARAIVFIGTGGSGLLAIAIDSLVADWRTLLALHSDVIAPAEKRLESSEARKPSRSDSRRRVRSVRDGVASLVDHWSNARPTAICDLPGALPTTSIPSTLLRREAVSLPDAITQRLRQSSDSVPDMGGTFLTALVIVLQHATQKPVVGVWEEHDALADILHGGRCYPHLIEIDYCSVASFDALLRAVTDARLSTAPHSGVPVDLVWRATMRRIEATEGRVSFRYARPVATILPLLNSGRLTDLDFWAADLADHVTVGVTYNMTSVHTSSAKQFVNDWLSVLEMIADNSVALLSSLVRGAPPAGCPLCAKRAAAQE